jgi:enoyl-[acyl-carrier protein] reductase I
LKADTLLSLEGKRGIVLGIANRHSIAYGIAEVLSEQGAELCITYLNEKSKLFVAPLARSCFR